MRVAVLGAGIMGSGIAQVAAMAGHDVVAFDVSPRQLEKATTAVEKSLARFVKAGKLNDAGAASAASNIEYTAELKVAAAGADVVIEAAPELLELKQEAIAAAALVAKGDAVLGTNTSEISIKNV